MSNNALAFVKQLQKSSSAGGSTLRLLISYSKLQMKTFLAPLSAFSIRLLSHQQN